MSVSDFKLKSESLTYGADNIRQYTRSGYVEVSEKEDAYDIYKSGKVPQIGDEHPSDEGAFVTSINADWERERRYRSPSGDIINPYRDMYIMEIIYKNVNMKNWNALPWERGAYNVSSDALPYQWQLQKGYTEEGDREKQNVPIQNTASDPLFVETVRSNTILRFEYDTRDFKPDWHNKYIGSCNKTALTIAGYPIDAQKGKIKKIHTTTQFSDRGVEYKKLAIEIEIENEVPVRYKEVLNVGFNVKKGTTQTEPIYLTKVSKDDPNNGGEYKAYSKLDLSLEYEKKADKITEVVPLSEDGRTVLNVKDPAIEGIYLKFYDTWIEGWETLGFPEEAEERVSVN